MDEIQIDSMELGGSKATVVPSPQTVTNFSGLRSLLFAVLVNILKNGL